MRIARWLALSALILGAARGVAAAEICRFRASAADDPLRRWFSSQELTCTEQGTALTFPAGLWNVFVRAPAALSAEPILVDGASAPRAIDPPLVPAATLVVRLPPGRTGVIYATRDQAAFPAGERSAVLPDQELWLFILEKSVPVGVVPIPPLAAGSEREIDARNPTPRAVVGWVTLSDGDRFAASRAPDVASPAIRFKAAEKDFEARALPAPAMLNGALFLLYAPSAGNGELQLSGRGWMSERRTVTMGPEPVTLVRQPLVARATATVTVQWSGARDLAAAVRALTSCDRRAPAGAAERTLSLSICSSASDSASCRVVRFERLDRDAGRGTFTYDELPAGFYRAQLKIGDLEPFEVSGSVDPFGRKTLEVRAAYLDGFGHLTYGGRPLGADARLAFAAGEWGFAEGKDGAYKALLKQPIRVDQKIDVIACDGEKYYIVTDERMVPGRPYDLEIPDNALGVTVVDAFTTMPLNDATVRAVVSGGSGGRSPVATLPFPQTRNADGRYLLKGVPVRPVRLEVSRAGYRKQELDPFLMPRRDRKEIAVQLVPLDGTEGRIVSSQEFERGAIVWATPAGVETERTELFADGTFFFLRSHRAGETMTVVSSSHPLWTVFAPPPDRRRALELRFPDTAQRRAAEVAVTGVPEREATLIGLEIGGLRVPISALALHMRLRGAKPIVMGGGYEPITEIAETAPIRILRSASFLLRLTPTAYIDSAVDQFVPTDARVLPPGMDARVTFEGK